MGDIKANIWKIYLYKLFSSFWLIAPILMPFYISNGLTATQVYIVQAIYAATILILEIPSGYLSDVIGRKKTLILGALFLPIGLLVYAFSYSFIGMVIAEMILAITASMMSGTDSAMLYDTLAQIKNKSDYKKIEGKAQFYQKMGDSISSVLGGLLALVALRLPFYINFGTALILLPLAILLVEPKRKKLTSKNHLKEIFRIVKYTLNHGKIRSLMIYSALITSVGIIGVWSYYIYYGQVGLSIGFYGILFAIFGLCSAYGAKKAHLIEARIGKSSSLFLLLLISLVFLLLAFIKSTFLIPLIFINGFIWGFSGPLFADYLNKFIKSNIRATVLSVNSMVGRFSFVILSPIFGKLVDIHTLSFAYVSLSIFFLIAGAICLLLLKKNKVI